MQRNESQKALILSKARVPDLLRERKKKKKWNLQVYFYFTGSEKENEKGVCLRKSCGNGKRILRTTRKKVL